MSFIDLATLTLHRRNELEVRINAFLNKCDHAINDIHRMKVQATNFVSELNCDPSDLKERFLNCMKQLDEFTYLITDFNLAVRKFDESNQSDYPVHDNVINAPTPAGDRPVNLMDVLSEPTPSTSTACFNHCPTEKPRRKKVNKEEQLLIGFSSASTSSESVPQKKGEMVTKEVQCELNVGNSNAVVKASPTQTWVNCNLPAQEVLQMEHVYTAVIMSIDDITFWVITGNIDEAYDLMRTMTEYYKCTNNYVPMSVDEIKSLNYCVFYDEDSDSYYRALFINVEDSQVEVFLVDTGEVRKGAIQCLRPLLPRFCTQAPFARCCQLAGIDFLTYHNEELLERQYELMKDFVGTACQIKVDDNTSECLGVYVILPSKQTLNNILIQKGLAVSNKPKAEVLNIQGLPEVLPQMRESEIDISNCPEYDDPVEAVTGYSNRDEADICKHYKGGPAKTCFKGSRCTKKHIMKHPDGWTLDRVEVPAKISTLPLPAPGSWPKVLVTYVCHFDRLFVQFAKDKEPEEEVPSFGVVLPPTSLPALIRDMNSPAARMSYKPLTISPAPGELVAAMYPADNQWYRARVLTVTRADQNVEVMYVDYGNVGWVKEDEIRILDPRYWRLPMQAIRCVMAGVRATTSCSRQWALAKQGLAVLTQERVLQAHVIGREFDELIVELFDAEGYSVAEKLAAQGLVKLNEYTVTDDRKVTKMMLPA